jgi:hypothetical protein
MPLSYAASDAHIEGRELAPQIRTRRQITRYWSAFAGTVALMSMLVLSWTYEPGQDHAGSISLKGDGSWFHNYQPAFEIQDQEIFYHGIGHSIANAQRADIIFLGPSYLVFGIDWRVFEEFEQKHHIKMFNLGFAGVGSGEFSLRLMQKWGLHPKMWIIHAEMYQGNFAFSFFNMVLPDYRAFGAGSPARVVKVTWMRAFLTAFGRNIQWRMKIAAGLLEHDSYRSATTGNWYLDNWLYHIRDDNPAIKSRVSQTCPENPDEIAAAKPYLEAIGGQTILIQVPSVNSCAQRIHELAAALGVPSFTVDPTQFTSNDGGGHLDARGARKYSTMLFAWLEQQPEFQRLFSK